VIVQRVPDQESDPSRHTASGLNPVRRLMENSNIDPGAAREMKASISGQRHKMIDAHWFTGVF
jgi:hypothetical protein